MLAGALKDLNVAFGQTAQSWRDAAREAFEEDFLRALDQAVRTASTSMDQIELLLEQVRRECR
jgi:hypothetical protein